MADGWDDGDEPWNDPKYYDMSFSEMERRHQWEDARYRYNTETGKDTTRNDKLFPRSGHLKSEKEIETYRCFVATSAYESDNNNPTVQRLREYKQVLKDYRLGRAFIDFYYGGFGSKAAKVLDKAPVFKPIVRWGLRALVAAVIDPVLERREMEESEYQRA